MNTTRWLLLIFALLLMAGAVDVACQYPQLPDRMATHFDAQGHPNGWASRPTFLTLYILLMTFMALIFPGCLALLPILPPSLINMPHREYWLAPERVEYTRELVGRFLMALGNVTVAFLIALLHLTMRANLGPQQQLGQGIWIALAGFVVLDLAITIWLLLVFRVPGR
jgi:uncharacterized membrane protein